MRDNYDRPIQIADGVHWVGFCDRFSKLHCNPYLIVEGEEAVLIDGGSRPDFPAVMMKIMQTGVAPSSIKALVYQHYDPDLCGSIPHLEDLIDCRNLKIISDKTNHMFIRHYSVRSELLSLEEIDFHLDFASGRRIEFVKTPYAHCMGSFVSFDSRSGALFSSDLFGSYGTPWDLFVELAPECATCSTYERCPIQREDCPLPGILGFHQIVMPSTLALRHALHRMAGIPFRIIAPQHGSVIRSLQSASTLFEKLYALDGVGIDGLVGDRVDLRTCDLSSIKERGSAYGRK